jgi:hypothetical protein
MFPVASGAAPFVSIPSGDFASTFNVGDSTFREPAIGSSLFMSA